MLINVLTRMSLLGVRIYMLRTHAHALNPQLLHYNTAQLSPLMPIIALTSSRPYAFKMNVR